MTQTERQPAYDFAFFTGTWQVRHRRLNSPFDSTSGWSEFEGTTKAHTQHGGAIHWVNSWAGRLEPPVRGRFTDGIGTFYGTDEVGGQPVQVRFVWSEISETAARRRQGFSVDGATTWVDNWEMRFTKEAK
jgi:hypothetical protein